MKLLLISMLAAFLLLAGCAQEQGSTPLSPNTPQQQLPSQGINEVQNNTPQNDTQPQRGFEQNSPTPSSAQPLNSTQNQENTPEKTAQGVATKQQSQISAECQGSDSLAICVAGLAIEAKDVSICTQLEIKDDILSCITQWCLSSARDFTQCESLNDIDYRLGCLNKCNPNTNT